MNCQVFEWMSGAKRTNLRQKFNSIMAIHFMYLINNRGKYLLCDSGMLLCFLYIPSFYSCISPCLNKQRIMAKREKLRVNHRQSWFFFILLLLLFISLVRTKAAKESGRWQINLLAHHSFLAKKTLSFFQHQSCSFCVHEAIANDWTL